MKITVLQKSQDGQTINVDHHANLIDFGAYIRLMYREENGADVVLDLMDREVSMKRTDNWTTQGIFREGTQTELHVINEHGNLVFDVDIESMQQQKSLFYIRYRLSQNGQHIDTLELECRWEPEV